MNETARDGDAGADRRDATADPVIEQARKRAAELFEMAEDENWLGI